MMTFRNVFLNAYAMAESKALFFFVLAISIPALGTGAALVGREGPTDKDGLLYANVFILVAVLQFSAVCAALVWFSSMFRGWSIWFIGSLAEPLIILVLAVLLIRRLFQRAFRLAA